MFAWYPSLPPQKDEICPDTSVNGLTPYLKQSAWLAASPNFGRVVQAVVWLLEIGESKDALLLIVAKDKALSQIP